MPWNRWCPNLQIKWNWLSCPFDTDTMTITAQEPIALSNGKNDSNLLQKRAYCLQMHNQTNLQLLLPLKDYHDAWTSSVVHRQMVSMVMTAHHLMSTAMSRRDDSNRPVNSLMLPLHDLHGFPLRRPLSTVPCSTIFGSVSCWQTWPNHDSLLMENWIVWYDNHLHTVTFIVKNALSEYDDRSNYCIWQSKRIFIYQKNICLCNVRTENEICHS